MDGEAGGVSPLFSLQQEQLQIGVLPAEESTGMIAAQPAEEDCGVCAICLDKILIRETAVVKGCEHTYCVTCILTWATYREVPSCPQCKHPFNFLSVHRSLDGCIHDHLFEESVCLLLRAPWFVPEDNHPPELFEDNSPELFEYDDNYDEDLEEAYYNMRSLPSSSSVRIGNRRWGGSGYVRGGRKEARPVSRQLPPLEINNAEVGSSSAVSKDKEAKKEPIGRRAKRALKREAADKAAAAVAVAKHQQHLQRLGRQ